jgi:tRNA-methyltransferase O
VVNLLRREGCSLYVRGVDMLDGTPVLDIKPYLSSVPCKDLPSVPGKDLRRGWVAEAEARAFSADRHDDMRSSLIAFLVALSEDFPAQLFEAAADSLADLGSPLR